MDATRWLLALALSELLHGAFGSLVLVAGAALDPTRWWVVASAKGAVAGLAFGAFSAALASVALVAAIGTALRRPWGRGLGWVVGGGAVVTACAPIGVLVMWSLWETRPPPTPRGPAADAEAEREVA